MSRAGYTDDVDDPLMLGRWRAAVNSAFRGRRGQAFLREMLMALDAMPDKRLIREHLVNDGDQAPYGDADFIVGADELIEARGGTVAPVGAVCALGAIGKVRGTDMAKLDPHESEEVAAAFGIAHAMACEIVYWNDDGGTYRETPEERWKRMRAWVAAKIQAEEEAQA